MITFPFPYFNPKQNRQNKQKQQERKNKMRNETNQNQSKQQNLFVRSFSSCMGMATSSILVLVLVLSLTRLSSAASRLELVTRVCRETPARNASNYVGEFRKIVASMGEKMRRDRFAFGQSAPVGTSERLYMLSQCMPNVPAKECVKCFKGVTQIMSSCFPATGGRIFYGNCFMRVENYSFFNHAVEPDDFRKCGDSVDKRPEFSKTGRQKIDELASITMEKGFGVALKKTGNVYFFAAAVCLKTMDPNMCGVCIKSAAQSCASCLPSTECRLLNSGCIMRYADYDFASNHARMAKENLMMYASYVFGGLAVSALIAVVGIYVGKAHYKRRKAEDSKTLQMNLSRSKGGMNFLEFNYSTLEKATLCFDHTLRLGQGGYGEVFKGTLPDGREIAIKRLFACGKIQRDDICNEIDIISRAQHKNLVRFLGCCFTNTNSFLVYEFLVNKSLDQILFDQEKKKELDWKKRWQIIMGIAEGLEYLHNGCQLKIIHRDVKTSNILLDSKFKPKIADFGLAKCLSCTRNQISNATIAGTCGYLAPEYLTQGRLTEKVDVYGFGVVVVEIVTGVSNNKLRGESSFESLVAHVWKHYQSNTVPIIVEKSMDIEDIEEIKRVVQVGLLCTQESPDLRPNMTMVIQMLKNIDGTELPQPSSPPFIDENLELSASLTCRCKSCMTHL